MHFLPDTIGHNVIGELTGSEFPDEIITIGGHLDSGILRKELMMMVPVCTYN
jgi:hypothetical protein